MSESDSKTARKRKKKKITCMLWEDDVEKLKAIGERYGMSYQVYLREVVRQALADKKTVL